MALSTAMISNNFYSNFTIYLVFWSKFYNPNFYFEMGKQNKKSEGQVLGIKSENTPKNPR